jgi:hypothetical protein
MNDAWELLNIITRLDTVAVGGTFYTIGSRVRIKPKGRADIIDIILADKTAIIESIEQDLEQQIYLVLVLDDDPGRELGLAGQPGHRFFYRPDEVEILGAARLSGNSNKRG